MLQVDEGGKKISLLPGEVLQAHEVDIFEKMRIHPEAMEGASSKDTQPHETGHIEILRL